VALRSLWKTLNTLARAPAASTRRPSGRAVVSVSSFRRRATLRVSLWGMADGDDVTILFECDLADRIVYASNRIS
jgi:hypothetical protein